MKKFHYLIASFTIVSWGLSSCSDDKNEPIEQPGGGSGTMEQYSPEESKEFLEETATEALNMLNPNDQKEIIDLLGYFTQRYGDLDLPENFYYEENYNSYLFDSLGKGIENMDAATITRAVVDWVYNINFQDFKGVYEPGRYEWQQVEESNDIIFRFNDKSGQNCELKASGSSNYYDTSLTWEEEYYYWDTETTQINFRVPAEIVVTLTAGGNTLLSARVISNVSFENHTFEVNAEVNFANISVTAKTNGNDSKVNENLSISLNGAKYLTSAAYLTGNHLCDLAYWNDYYNGNDEENKFNEMFKSGEGTVTLLDKVSVDVIYTWTPGLSDLWFDDGNLTAYQVENMLNTAFKANVRYNNTTTVQASLVWTTETDRWGYVDVVPVLKFPDDTTYYFEDYFHQGFNSVENLFNSIVRKYESVINAAF